MATDEGDQRRLIDRFTAVRNRIRVHTLVVLLAGVLAGSSLSVVGKDTVLVPVLGTVPGVLLGSIGVLVAIGVYRQVGCCESCNQTTIGFGSGCRCEGECGDSCSYDA